MWNGWTNFSHVFFPGDMDGDGRYDLVGVKKLTKPDAYGNPTGGAGAAKDDAEGTDFHATAQGHVSITPLKVDLTDHDNLGYWAQTAARLATGAAAAPGA